MKENHRLVITQYSHNMFKNIYKHFETRKEFFFNCRRLTNRTTNHSFKDKAYKSDRQPISLGIHNVPTTFAQFRIVFSQFSNSQSINNSVQFEIQVKSALDIISIIQNREVYSAKMSPKLSNN